MLTNNLRETRRNRIQSVTRSDGTKSETILGTSPYRQNQLSLVIAPQMALTLPLTSHAHRCVVRRSSYVSGVLGRVDTVNNVRSETLDVNNSPAGVGVDIHGNSRMLDAEWNSLVGRCYEKIFDQLRNGPDLAVDVAERRQTLKMMRKYLNFKAFATAFVSSVVKTKGYRKIPKSNYHNEIASVLQKQYVDRQWRRMARAWDNSHPVERQMLRDKARAAPKKVRTGPHGGRRAVDWATSQYLEYRYGWLPVAHTLYDTCDAVRRRFVSSWTHVKARSGKLKTRQSYQGSGSGYYDPKQFVSIQGRYRVQIGTYWSLPQTALNTVAQFTSLNPISWAWELLTLSFVVDWFVNIGQWLQNWENYYLYKNSFQGGYVSYSWKETRSLRAYFYFEPVIPLWPNGSWRDSSSLNRRIIDEFADVRLKEREVLLTLPTPNGPKVQLGLNTTRLLDAASLLWGSTKRFR